MKTYYEISLKIRIINTDTELSYYEVWRKNVKYLEPYCEPVLDKVFKREKPDIELPEDNDQWCVLVKDGFDAFNKGRDLIRDYLTSNDWDTYEQLYYRVEM